MRLFGVVNCSPDSLNQESFVGSEAAAVDRIDALLASGADGIDIGGQGSTEHAGLTDWSTEWGRIQPALRVALAHTASVSVDTWRPEVAEAALNAGATILNAANGMQTNEFWEIAARHKAIVVLPFMNGTNPLELEHVTGDPIDRMLEYFEERLRVASTFGLRESCLIDPGTGFGPHGWAWEDRYRYQKHVYSNLHRLRVLDLPLYIPLPWRETPQHAELLHIVLTQRPEFGRAHFPARVRAAEAQLADER